MKRHVALFFVAFLLVGGIVCIAAFWGVKRQEASSKINDYGLLKHYFKNESVPDNCNILGYSGETYEIKGVTLKLLSYIFDGYQAKCVFSVSGKQKTDVEEFGIDTGGTEEVKNCTLFGPRKTGKMEDEMVSGMKYIYWSNSYRPNEEKVIHLKYGIMGENLHTFHLKETTDTVTYQGIDYKAVMSPIGLYIHGSGAPHEVGYIQENVGTKKLIKNWQIVDKKLYLFSEFLYDDVAGSYYGFRKLIDVNDKTIVAKY